MWLVNEKHRVRAVRYLIKVARQDGASIVESVAGLEKLGAVGSSVLIDRG